MKITFLTVGKNSDAQIEALISRYLKRLSHYVKFEAKTLPDGKGDTPEVKKTREGSAIISSFASGDYVVLLDERGKEPTSRGFSEMINSHLVRGTRNLVFVVGGPFGFSQEVYNRADELMALSKMTMTHEMVRLLFVEQVYRAFTIIRGESYHHD